MSLRLLLPILCNLFHGRSHTTRPVHIEGPLSLFLLCLLLSSPFLSIIVIDSLYFSGTFDDTFCLSSFADIQRCFPLKCYRWQPLLDLPSFILRSTLPFYFVLLSNLFSFVASLGRTKVAHWPERTLHVANTFFNSLSSVGSPRS